MSYTFVCIGTNKIVPDSFGPRVGDKLKQVFYSSPEISVYGTMQSPVHLKNATYFLEKLENKKHQTPRLLANENFFYLAHI